MLCEGTRSLNRVGTVSAAFSYPRAKASTSFPAVLNLLKRSELIDLIVENTFPLILQEA